MSRSPENTFADGYHKQISSIKLLETETNISPSSFPNLPGGPDSIEMANCSTQCTSYPACNSTEFAKGRNCHCNLNSTEISASQMSDNNYCEDFSDSAKLTSSAADFDADNSVAAYEAGDGDNISDNGFKNYVNSTATTATAADTAEISGIFTRMPSQQYKVGKYLVAVHRKITRQDSYFLSHHKTRPSLFGVPILIPHTENGSHKDLYCSVWLQVNRLLSPLPAFTDQSNHAADCDDSLGYDFPFTLRAVKHDGLTCAHCAWSGFCRGCEIPCNDELLFKGSKTCSSSALSTPEMTTKLAYLSNTEDKTRGATLRSEGSNNSDYFEDFTIAIDWDPTALHLRYQSTLERLCKDHESVAICRKEQVEPVDLNHCLRAFTSEEKLEEWYHCSHCKGKKPATKKLQIWKLPPILIVHLKRFNCVNEKWVKSQKVVHFPFDDFDPTPYLASVPQETILRHRELLELPQADYLGSETEPNSDTKLTDISEYDNANQQKSATPPPVDHQQQQQQHSEINDNNNASVKAKNLTNSKHCTELDDCYNIVLPSANHSGSKKNAESEDEAEEQSDESVDLSQRTMNSEKGNDDYATVDNRIPSSEANSVRYRKHVSATMRKRLISTSLTKTPIIDGKFEDFHQHKLKTGEDEFDPKYKLYAVVCHSGLLNGGHYISYAANQNGTWYCFNDSSCREIPSQPNIDPSSAYLLFYERKGLDYEPYLPNIDGKTLPNGELNADTDDGSEDLKKLCRIS